MPSPSIGAVPRRYHLRREDDDWKVIHWHGDAPASGQNGAIAQQQLSAPYGTLASDSANPAAGTERGRG